MDLLPAIDLRGGRVVRLRRGDDAQRTTYSEAPLEVLARYVDAGIQRVHIVDLDAAFGEAPQRPLIEELARTEGGAKLQVGGGLRTHDDARWAFDAGVERIVMTSMIARDFDGFATLVSESPHRVVAALDVDGGELRTAGWTQSAERSLEDICRQLAPLPLGAVLVTDISRDGMGVGPNFELARFLARATSAPGILSGGVASLGDLRRAASIAEFESVIVGRALYDGAFDLFEAIDACRVEEISA